MHEVREVLRLWVRGESKRGAARVAGVNRKTVDRYVAAGVEVGLAQDGDDVVAVPEAGRALVLVHRRRRIPVVSRRGALVC